MVMKEGLHRYFSISCRMPSSFAKNKKAKSKSKSDEVAEGSMTR